MLPQSISTRVLSAFAAVFVLALALLSGGVLTVDDVRAENDRVQQLSGMLAAEEEHDQVQQQLRLGLGEVTRVAERGQPVPVAARRRTEEALRRFAENRGGMTVAASRALGRLDHDRMSAGGDGGEPLAAEIRLAVTERREAARRFAAIGADLLRAALDDPAGIKPRMPGFLAGLKRLEHARSDLRLRLVRGIDAEVSHNARKMQRSIDRVLLGGAVLLIVIMLLATWLRRRVIFPIVEIADRLRQFNAGLDASVVVPGLERRDELGELARGLAEYRHAMVERREAERRVAFLAHHDVLTGLPNRLMFEERLAHELARARRTGERVAVFAIDLDEFKAINDRFGHAGGDAALRKAATLLSDGVRSDDLVARLGGDEFAIIQVARDQPRAAEGLLARLFDALAATASDDIALRMSVGVAISGPDMAFEELYNLADMAMYRAKSEGRNTARFFDEGLKEEVRLRWRLGHDLEGAIERGEMYLAYQPIADARTLRVEGYEALLRWSHPELGEISPELFIPLAESSGGIGAIGLWVADRAMATAAQWDPRLSLALNLSAIQFRHDRLAESLLALARRHGIAPARLEFEVTESATLLGVNRAAALTALRALQDAGARVVMDDFGTGHSSLGNLREFRFDKLKIDRSFVMSMLDHAPSASIVRSIIALGHSLGVPVVAEGVEGEGELAALRASGCHQVQGYLIGRPARMAEERCIEA
ncbi:putative bifunctional diguanylate cyclase/phosphodiesterase [Sphingomonas adhaesiva]|uniref:putative bifunctional diguanylate cyclase/phosphodiesterase n=1 Tax=Sphingomonas adhaesiva TaxID=28212 RepID=UPI002FFC155A